MGRVRTDSTARPAGISTARDGRLLFSGTGIGVAGLGGNINWGSGRSENVSEGRKRFLGNPNDLWGSLTETRRDTFRIFWIAVSL